MATTFGVILVLLILSAQTVRCGSLPVFQQRVVPQSVFPGSGAGYSVAITPSGLRAVIASPFFSYGKNGSLSIYDRTGSTWKETAKLEEFYDASSYFFGVSVGIAQDGLTVVAGCPDCNHSTGSVFVFEQIGESWTGAISLDKEEPSGIFQVGEAVAISQDGTTIACTASIDNTALVFVKKNGFWVRQDNHLTAPGVDTFAYSVALSGNGNFLLVGTSITPADVLIFYKRNSSSMWYQSGPLIFDPNNLYGIASTIAMTADGMFVVSASVAEGSASVFKLSADETTYQVLQQLSAPGSDIGYAYREIAISSLGEYIVIGDPSIYADTSYTKGGAFIFKLLNDRAGFKLVGNITMPFFNATLSYKSGFGISVAVSDHGNFLIGAGEEDANRGKT